MKFVLASGWQLNKVRMADKQSVPAKQKMVCLRRRKDTAPGTGLPEEVLYEPEVMDLSKVEVPVYLLVSAP